MNKKDVEKLLKQGKRLNEIFCFQDGQECEIYKADKFAVSDDIIYIPDINLNNIVTDRPMAPNEILEAIGNMYSGNDFVDECNGNVPLAKFIFEYVDFQHPLAVFGYIRQFNDEEMLEKFGKTYDQLFSTKTAEGRSK